jgi:hypothetical protein
MLLVPGFLFTRLELPPRNTVIAELRAWPRMLANAYIGLSLGSAICLAAAENHVTRSVFSIVILLGQLMLQVPLLPNAARRVGRRTGADQPTWLASSERTQRLFRRPDRSFKAVGMTTEE